MASGDHVAMTMLAMAETLRQLQPPKVKMAIKCAKGALTLSLSVEMTAHVRFQLGKLYFFYTENFDLALQCLESAFECGSFYLECFNIGMSRFREMYPRWMDTVPLTVFACLMTIVNSALQCNYERAAKYYTIAASRNPCEYGVLRSVQRMRMALNEMMAQCNIMACHPSMAVDNVLLLPRFNCYSQGHYCSYLREPEAAEKHFLAATKFKSCKDKNIWVMTHVNLAITYLAQCKLAEFYEIADQLTPNRIANCSLIVRNNAQFLHAFHAYLLNKVLECRTLIAECMETAKAEDLFRLYGLSILLFSIVQPVEAEVFSKLETSGKSTAFFLKFRLIY
uniref:MAU2 chromatid cohesion factor homolog n=1 Tax=Angiostrongylus cantonensis TaxID=6313 RepID=A0A158PBI3_ANGCA